VSLASRALRAWMRCTGHKQPTELERPPIWTEAAQSSTSRRLSDFDVRNHSQLYSFSRLQTASPRSSTPQQLFPPGSATAWLVKLNPVIGMNACDPASWPGEDFELRSDQASCSASSPPALAWRASFCVVVCSFDTRGLRGQQFRVSDRSDDGRHSQVGSVLN